MVSIILFHQLISFYRTMSSAVDFCWKFLLAKARLLPIQRKHLSLVFTNNKVIWSENYRRIIGDVCFKHSTVICWGQHTVACRLNFLLTTYVSVSSSRSGPVGKCSTAAVIQQPLTNALAVTSSQAYAGKVSTILRVVVHGFPAVSVRFPATKMLAANVKEKHYGNKPDQSSLRTDCWSEKENIYQ